MKIENGKNFVEYSVDSIMIDEDTEIDYILINLVYTVPEERGKGIARKLLTDAIAAIKATSDLEIKLCAMPKEESVDMDRLVAFYKSIGFSVDENQDYDGVFMTYGK